MWPPKLQTLHTVHSVSKTGRRKSLECYSPDKKVWVWFEGVAISGQPARALVERGQWKWFWVQAFFSFLYCIRGWNGSRLVSYEDGRVAVVLGRLLRKVLPEMENVLKSEQYPS